MSSMKQVYMDYYPKLMQVLPMNDALFIAQLYAGRFLPGDTKDVIQSRHTRAEKVQCFLDNCIKPAFLDDESNDIFLALLKMMENSDNVVLKSVAKEIESKIHVQGTETNEETIHLAMQKQASLSTNGPSVPTHWTKGKLLGSGAFGKVYICHDQDNNLQLAVKEIEIDPSIPPEDVKSLEREIDLLKNLKHERIVLYYGTTRTDRNICIFMEYMTGGSVYSRVRSHGAFTEMLTKKYTRQILEGTNYLHSQKIIHRDIKGANVLIDANEDVKIADFGASKRLKTIHQSKGFSKNTFVGTPHWMAPEVIDQDTFGPVGPKADIWSIGCTVIEMLTAKPPFNDLETNAAIFAIATKPVSFVLPPSCSEHVSSFLAKCLTKDIEARSTASELLQHAFVLDVN